MISTGTKGKVHQRVHAKDMKEADRMRKRSRLLFLFDTDKEGL